MTAYKWSASYRSSVSAEVAGEELDRIKFDRGALTADAVVDESRADEAPLHPAFEWDDYSAAERYRRQQAQTMIRALVVIDEPEAEPRQKYVLISSEVTKNKTAYEDAAVVVEHVDMFADAISRLEGEVIAAQRSVQALERLAAMQGAEPERMARISLAMKALEAASAAVQALH